jgi:hypothetical protein
MLPAGCTATIYNTQSCMVSAGHCISGGSVIQFRVPDSLSNCNLVNPPVSEQFSMTGVQSVNGGVGNDWAVLTTGTNNLGETAYQRYGVLRPIADAPPAVGQPVAVWGYGIDSQCTRNQTQQFHSATIASVGGTWIEHWVDITFGNSGSSLIRNDEILGIITHCPCPGAATRIDHPSFAAAREALCPAGDDCPWDLDGNGSVGTADLLDLLSQWGTFPGGPPDFDGGGVGTSDLLEMLSNWGQCP